MPWMRVVVVGVSGAASVEQTGTEAHDCEIDGVRGRCPMKKQSGVEVQGAGLKLVPKRAVSVEQEQVLREGSTGRVVSRLSNVLKLSRVWAVAESVTAGGPEQRKQTEAMETDAEPKVELAFYRKYTEGMLRRYLRLSMQSGRVPSLLGREMFQGNVSSYRMHGFEDAVIFCYDVEKRLGLLQVMDQQLIKRIALQQYTQGEAAGMLGLSLRSCIRQYGRALDQLTELFLEARLLEPLKSCQERKGEEAGRSASF